MLVNYCFYWDKGWVIRWINRIHFFIKFVAVKLLRKSSYRCWMLWRFCVEFSQKRNEKKKWWRGKSNTHTHTYKHVHEDTKYHLLLPRSVLKCCSQWTGPGNRIKRVSCKLTMLKKRNSKCLTLKIPLKFHAPEQVIRNKIFFVLDFLGFFFHLRMSITVYIIQFYISDI